MVMSGYRLNTQVTYNSVQKSYILFCQNYNLLPVPADEKTILMFLAYVTPRVSGHSLNVYLSAIKSLHVLQGYVNSPTENPRVKLAVKGSILNSQPPSRKSPITYDIMVMISNILASDFNSIMYWSAMTLAFFGCLRAGEFTVPSTGPIQWGFVLRVHDVKFGVEATGPYMSVVIGRTKQKPNGVTLYIGCSKSAVCAYCTMLHYLNIKRVHDTKYVHTPLFMSLEGTVLHKNMFVTYVKQMLSSVGIDADSYSGHSFRSGSATSAAKNNMKDFEIKDLGHWASSAYQRYIHTPVSHQIQYASRLAGHNN